MVKTKTVRRTCKKAKFSHCDKLEDIAEGLIAASVTQGMVLVLLLGMLFMIRSGTKERKWSQRLQGRLMRPSFRIHD